MLLSKLNSLSCSTVVQDCHHFHEHTQLIQMEGSFKKIIDGALRFSYGVVTNQHFKSTHLEGVHKKILYYFYEVDNSGRPLNVCYADYPKVHSRVAHSNGCLRDENVTKPVSCQCADDSRARLRRVCLRSGAQPLLHSRY